MGALKSSASLQTRVGIATGLVVVGDLIGSGEAQERGIVGETPNLAARLQGIAEPNTVVIAESTRKLLGNLFELEDLGPKDLKGIAGPVRAWAALRASSVESRFEALRTATDTDWSVARKKSSYCCGVGRRRKLAKAGRADLGRAGYRQVAHCRGNAGTPWRASRTPAYAISARRIIRTAHSIRAIAQLERAAGFRREDTPERRLAKLEAVLAQATNDLSEVAPLLADLLSIPTGERYPALNLTPQKRKEKTLQALVAQVGGLGGAATGADDLRGRALERSDHPRVARPADRSGADRAAPGDHHLPAGVLPALDRTPSCDDAHSQSPAAPAAAPR